MWRTARSRDSQSAMRRRNRTGRIYSRGDKAPAVRCASSLSPSSSSPASRLALPILPPPLLSFLFPSLLLPLRGCFFVYRARSGVSFVLVSRAASIWKLVSIVRETDLPFAFIYPKLLRLFAKRCDRYVLEICYTSNNILNEIRSIDRPVCINWRESSRHSKKKYHLY